MDVLCPGCQARQRVTGPGTWRCSCCKSPFSVGAPAVATATLDPPEAPSDGAQPLRSSESRSSESRPSERSAPSNDAVDAAPPLDASALDLPGELRERALPWLRTLERDPRAKPPYIQIAELHLQAGKKHGAIRWMTRYLEIHPGDQLARQRLAVLRGEARPQRAVDPETETRRRGVERSKRAWAVAAVLALLTVAGLVGAKIVVPMLSPPTVVVASDNLDSYHPRWAPFGLTVAYIKRVPSGHELRLHDARTGEERTLVELGDEYGKSFAWAPSGDALALRRYVSNQRFRGHVIELVDSESGDVESLIEGGFPSWSPDGNALAFVAPSLDRYRFFRRAWAGRRGGSGTDPRRVRACGGEICTISRLTGEVRKVTSFPGRSPAWSPAGDKIAFLYAGAITPGWLEQWESHGRSRRSAALPSPRSFRASPGDLCVVDADGGGLAKLTVGGGWGMPAWSPDGSRLAAARLGASTTKGREGRGELHLFDPRAGTSERLDLGGLKITEKSNVTFSPDGEAIYFAAPVEHRSTSNLSQDVFRYDLEKGTVERVETQHWFKLNFDLAPAGDHIAYETAAQMQVLEVWRTDLAALP